MGFYGYCKDSQAKKINLPSGTREAVMAGEKPCLQHWNDIIIVPKVIISYEKVRINCTHAMGDLGWYE